jgi:CRP-like cAMP-binding protein
MLTGIPVSFDDGQVIFRQGDAAADMYLIRAGSVRISRTGDDGAEQTIAYLSEGDYFGELALFDPGPRSATATAVGAIEVEVIDRPTFVDAMRCGDPDAKTLTAEISQRLRTVPSQSEE